MTWHSARGIACFVQEPHFPSSSPGAVALSAERAGGVRNYSSRHAAGWGESGRCPDGGGGSGGGGRSPHGALRRGRCGGARAALPWRSPPPPSRSASWARATGECGGPWQGRQLGGRRGPAFPEAVPARALLSVPARAVAALPSGVAAVRPPVPAVEHGVAGPWRALGRACAVPGGCSCRAAGLVLPPALSERRCCRDVLRGRSGRIEHAVFMLVNTRVFCEEVVLGYF